ncbi:Uncharacterised protein [Pseudomonas aeruginosa]|nr:Uncharacterised protein [Pseudomonas aeruginosa]
MPLKPILQKLSKKVYRLLSVSKLAIQTPQKVPLRDK